MSLRSTLTRLVTAGDSRLSTALLATVVACTASGSQGLPGADPDDSGGVADFEQVQGKLLMGTCTISSATPPLMTVALLDNETAYFTKRFSDGKITLNANQAAGNAPCEMASTGTIKVTASGTTASSNGRSVILDFTNGTFGAGTSAIVPGIVIDLSGATDPGLANTLKIRGASGADKLTFGAGAISGVYALNFDAASMATPAADYADVTFKQIKTVIVNGSTGNDVITGEGGLGTGAVFPAVLRMFGGAGDDSLTGGSGNDFLVGGTGADAFLYSPGTDTVDYSARSSALTIKTIVGANWAVAANGTDLSGDLTMVTGLDLPGDRIADGILVIKGGSGVDTVTIAPASTVSHTVYGGAGNDVFTGSTSGSGLDKFEGDLGDDVCNGATAAMSYASRATPVVVSTCTGTCAAGGPATDGDDNDGDPAMTVSAMGTSGSLADDGTASDKSVTFTLGTPAPTLAVGDVGKYLRVIGLTVANNNNSEVRGYKITAVDDTAHTVTVNVSSNPAFNEAALTGAITAWQIVTAERDNVRCGYVLGGQSDDVITGDSRDNTLRGGDGSDRLIGGAGDDHLYGDDGADILYGGAGADHLHGGADADTLVGGDDEDFLEGGTENDSFTCDGKNLPTDAAIGSAPGALDILLDFSSPGAGTDTKTGTDCNAS